MKDLAVGVEDRPVTRQKNIAAKIATAAACVLISIAAAMPFFYLGEPPEGRSRWTFRMPDTHDMISHYDQAVSFYNGLKAGEIYPRWEEETNRGYGAPATSYYPPGVYYLTAAVYAAARDWLRAIAGAHLLMMIAGVAAIYFYARMNMSRVASVAVMIAYAAFPYHLLDQYQRGAMAELLAFVWMPLMLLFGERLFRNTQVEMEALPHSSRRPALSSTLLNMGGLALSYGAFAWSHPPTAYQFSLMFGVFLLALAIMRREMRGLLVSGAALAVGLAISAAYLYPAAAEQELIRHEYVSTSWPYHESYVFAKTGYTMAYRGFFDLIDHTWLVNITAIVLCATVALIAQRTKTVKADALKQRIIAWTLVGIVSAFMMTSLSAPIGRRIPRIDIGVFAWRMLGVTTLMAALLIGAGVQSMTDAWKARKRAVSSICAAAASIALVGGVVFSGFNVAGVLYSAPLFEQAEEHLNYGIIPRTAPEDPTELPESPRAELESGEGEVVIERWDPQNRVIRADPADDDRLVVRTFNFPGWSARIDGEPADIQTGEELGEIQIELSPGAHRVTLDYLDTPPRRLGRLVTISAALAAALLLAAGAAMRLFRREPLDAAVG